MLKTVSPSTPTTQYEKGGTGVRNSAIGSTTGNPFTGVMSNVSGVSTDMFQTTSSEWDRDIFQRESSHQNTDIFETTPSNQNTDIFSTPSSNWSTDIFRPPSPFGNSDILQTVSSNGNITAHSRTPPTSPYVDIFHPLPSSAGSTASERKPSKSPFEIYQTPPSTQEEDIFKKPRPKVPEKPSALKVRLINGSASFKERTPSPVSSMLSDPKSSSLSDNSWQDVLQATSSRTPDFYQTPSSTRDDLFSPFQSKPLDLSSATSSSVNSDLFQTPSTSLTHQSTPFSNGFSSDQSSHTPGNPFYPIQSSHPPGNPLISKPSFGNTESLTVSADRKLNLLLTTPGGTEHNILQNTPSDVKNGSLSFLSLETETSTSTPSAFSRTKPLPRVPPKAHPRTKVHINTASQESASPVVDESSADINIEFTGEEKCVEDWPEDSPQHSSDWKPSGTLRLRRESIVEREREHGSYGGEKSGKKTLRRLSLPVSTRRRSKDKLVDYSKHGSSPTLHQRSERSDTSSPVKDLKEGLLVDVCLSDTGDQSQGEDSKSAKKLKFKGSQVLRRKSKEKLSIAQNSTESHSALELYEGAFVEKAGSVFLPTSPILEEPGTGTLFLPTTIIPEDSTQDERKVTPETTSQKKVLKKRLSNLNRRTLKEKQDLHPNIDDHSPYQDAEKEQELNAAKGIFMPLSGPSKDTELNGEGSEKEQDYYGMDLHDGKDLSEEDHHGEEVMASQDKKKKKKKHSVKIRVPRLSWRDSTNNSHPYGSSPGSQSRDYYLPEGAKGMGYEPPDRMKSDFYPSASTKEQDLFPSVEEEPPAFTSVGNIDPVRDEYGAVASPRYEEYSDPSLVHKGSDLFMAADRHGNQTKKTENYKPKKPLKFTVKRQKSKDKFIDEASKQKLTHSESDYQPSPQYKSDPMEDDFFNDADIFMEGRHGGANKWKTEEDYDPKYLEDDFPEKCSLHEDDELNRKELGYGKKTSQKSSVPHMTWKDQKSKAQLYEYEDPPGATSSDYYMSDAAKAEWASSQMDMRRAYAEEEEALETLPEEEEGDTDSLMEWWNTVEMWDEVPSDEESTLKEEETKSFTQTADKVHRGLRVFNKVFMEQAEVLYQHVLILHAIADDLSNFHRKAKVGSITGGTTMAVGGAAAIAGLALAPLTFGASLLVSAVGLGVVTAGGITSASAAISDKVHDVHDRKKIELVADDYLTRLTEVARCLAYVREGMQRLSRHPLLRRNNYYASSDWEVRRALQMVSLVREPADRAADIAERGTAALSGLFKHMDRYFVDRGGKVELRKTCKKEATGQVHAVATILQEGLVELNTIREQMLDAYGNI